MNSTLYTITQLGFVVLTLAIYVWTLLTFREGMLLARFSVERSRRVFGITLGVLVTWTLFISLFSIRGFFSDFSKFPPKMALVFVVPLFAVLVLTFFSKTLQEILAHIAPEKIIRLQVFRVFVETLIWLLLLQKLLPIQMSFEGRNFDILTGLSAPIVAWLIARKQWSPTLTILWNVAGLLLLFNIMIIAVLSMPTPLRVFMNEPANTIVATFPFIWLPGLLVPLAYTLHFFSLRQSLPAGTNHQKVKGDKGTT